MRIMIFDGRIYNLETVAEIHIMHNYKSVKQNNVEDTIIERYLFLGYCGAAAIELAVSPWFDDMEVEDAGAAEEYLLKTISLYMAGTIKPCAPLDLVETLNQMEEYIDA